MSLDDLIKEKYYVPDTSEYEPEENFTETNPIEDLISEVEYISSWSFTSLPEDIKKKTLDIELDKIYLKNKLLRQKMVWSKMASEREVQDPTGKVRVKEK